MRARHHGEQVVSSTIEMSAKVDLAQRGAPSVDFMFGNLSVDPINRLPEGQSTIDALIALGQLMAEDSSSAESGIPAAYTYFGQFIDHDITKTVFDPAIQITGVDPILAPSFNPVDRSQVPEVVSNARSAPLDLDSVYEGLAISTIQADGKFRLGELSPSGFFPIPTADLRHDLPRRPMIANPINDIERELDRQALIGDPRNDENLLVAQTHVAFLRSHNKMIDAGLNFDQARSAIRRRYQWSVLHDFLPRVCDPEVVSDVMQNGPQFWRIDDPNQLFIPIEFSTAAYRFGHSMIRSEYSHNTTFTEPPEGKVRATFNFFFTFTALSGDIRPEGGPGIEFETLPDNWPIEWHRFFSTAALPASRNPARRIDANLTPELANLRDFQGLPIASLMARLATRNLLRGYLLGLPTGQAVARHMGLPVVPRELLLSATPSGLKGLVEAAGLLDRTPLWFYILAEAGNPAGPDGQHLGKVGSRIVAETLWNLAKHATDSVITNPPSQAELDTGEYTLRGLIRIGQDARMPQI